MARGGLSQDPEKRAKQLATLAAGRAVREARRAAGLPSKRRESRSSAGDSRQTPNADGPANVRRGTYDRRSRGGSADDGSKRRKSEPATPPPATGNEAGDDFGLNRLERAYARLTGRL
jgi:hypothetical protein